MAQPGRPNRTPESSPSREGSGESKAPARGGSPRSAALIAFLLRVPRLILVLAVIAVLLGGAFAPAPFGPVLLAAIAALVAWLTWLNWGTASVSGRLIRLAVVAALLAFAVTKF